MASSPNFGDDKALVVPAQSVKIVKTFLEEHRILNKRRKIAPYTPDSTHARPSERDQRFDTGKWFIIPFLSRTPNTTSVNESDTPTLATHLGDLTLALTSRLPPDALKAISTITLPTSGPQAGSPPASPQPHNNPLRAAFHSALSALPAAAAETLSRLSLTPAQLAADLPGTYSIYPPLLLLPAHTFHRPSWTAFLAATTTHIDSPLSHTNPTLQHLLAHVAQRLSVTHIALNAPIAPHNTTAPHPATGAVPTAENEKIADEKNILRSPTSLTPLHGAFGPPPSPSSLPPSPTDFAAAFWATSRQNGIAQTWAPLHTMFSRGNVKEKARILSMGTVGVAARDGGCAAVDLYAGIGYFAFPYRRAGVRTVVGWEINGWSVEGLRRGAGLNGWGVRVVVPGGGGEEGDGGALEEEEERDFVVFCEDNAHAARRVEGMRQRLPPVRHVNAGLLPTSRGAWETAVRVLEPRLGGWVHLHENFGEREVRERAEEVVGEVRRIWGNVRAERCGGGLEVGADVGDVVRLEHVERVKTYAPGVLHCVLDIWIAPTGTKARA